MKEREDTRITFSQWLDMHDIPQMTFEAAHKAWGEGESIERERELFEMINVETREEVKK